MEYFDKYTSNSLASSCNQFYFISSADRNTVGRVYYKITASGKHEYSLLFTDALDSTYADGSQSQKNLSCGNWRMIEAKAAVCGKDIFASDFSDPKNASIINNRVCDFVSVTFNGEKTKTVSAGEVFFSDSFNVDIESGEYLCVELTFTGEKLPYHEESLLPIFIKAEEGWTYDKRMPLPAMIGCDRKVKSRIGYIGDSITQGIGVPVNSYTHWNAVLSAMLGNEYAYWNLGIGYARADDMASLGAWYQKAVHNDVLFVCFGVNDILQGFSAEEVKNSLAKIVHALKMLGKKVILQTLPPFDYPENLRVVWEDVNDYVKKTLSAEVDLVFDTVEFLGEKDAPHMARYGGHPNEEGCAVWAQKLYEKCKHII